MSGGARAVGWPFVAAGLLVASCSSGAPCRAAASASGSCPDLSVNGHLYVEWRAIKRPAILAEVGDATYPACNAASSCGKDEFGGLGATDVWKYRRVPRGRAVIGLREGTQTYVVFVRRGLDPATLR